jgi:RIO-like serine/threonine protein kinase
LIFKRDVRRICEYFERQGIITDYEALAESLWQKNKYPKIPEFSLGVLDDDDEGDRAYWENIKDQQ